MSDFSRAEYNRIKLLVSFLNDEDAVVISSVEEELMAIPHKYLPVLKEIQCDIEEEIIQKKLAGIILKKSFNEIELKILSWIQNPHDIFVPFDIIAKMEHQNRAVKSKFDMHYCGFDVFIDLGNCSSALDVVETLINRVSLFLRDSGYLKTNTVLFIKEKLPPWFSSAFINTIPFLAIAQRYDIPIVPLKVNESFVLAYKNTGDYEISFIEDPYLAIIILDDNENTQIVSFNESLNNGILNDIDELNNVELFSMFLKMLLIHYKDTNIQLFESIRNLNLKINGDTFF
ncbi:MAG: hypothetical protein PHT69_05890 [Bacteroidales bacterium]|nr:hypothetical protein [Bacteroidales bacterium]